MRAVTKQQQLALRHAHLVWSQHLEDPRQERGRRHLHQGLLALLVVGFACGRLGCYSPRSFAIHRRWLT